MLMDDSTSMDSTMDSTMETNYRYLQPVTSGRGAIIISMHAIIYNHHGKAYTYCVDRIVRHKDAQKQIFVICRATWHTIATPWEPRGE